MVKLEAQRKGDDIIISSDSFEHLLNCLDNRATTRLEDNEAIDDFCRQCREVLRLKPEELEIGPDESPGPTRSVYVRIQDSVLGQMCVTWPDLLDLTLLEDMLREGKKIDGRFGLVEVEKGLLPGDYLEEVASYSGRTIVLGDPDSKKVKILTTGISWE